VVEGILAATVWAFSHIDLDGDGMGRRTEKGYLHLINVLFRPALMVAGFVLASSAVVLLGTLFTAMFLPAMANAQGNSVTGLISILGFLGLYGVMMLTLIQTCFNWIYEVPDRVIGWAGQAANERFGRDMDGSVEGHAKQMMRWGGTATTAGIA
jgi:conjugal transfer/type IV secretion protein DotA/TraY